MDLNSKEFSVVKLLLLYYALIATNFTPHLIGNQLRDFIRENRIAQHIVGLMTLIVLVHTVTEHNNIMDSIKYAAIVYVLFVLTTKLDLHWNIVLISLMFCYYIYESLIEEYERHTVYDNNIPDDKKMEVIADHHNKNIMITMIVIMITLIGTILYSHKKHEQYGGGYDLFKYFIG